MPNALHRLVTAAGAGARKRRHSSNGKKTTIIAQANGNKSAGQNWLNVVHARRTPHTMLLSYSPLTLRVLGCYY